MEIERIAAEDKHDENRTIYSFDDDKNASIENIHDAYNPFYDHQSSSHIQLKSSNDKDLKDLKKTLEHYGIAIKKSGHSGVELASKPSEIARVRLGLWAEENLSGIQELDGLKFKSGIQERISNERYMPNLQRLDTDLEASIVDHVIKTMLENVPDVEREKASHTINKLKEQVTNKYTASLDAAKIEVEYGMLISNAVAALADAKLISPEDAHKIATDQVSERGAVLAHTIEGEYVEADLSLTPASAILYIESDFELFADGPESITQIITRGAQTQSIYQDLKDNGFDVSLGESKHQNFPDVYPKISKEGYIKVYAEISEVTESLTQSGYINQGTQSQIDAAISRVKEQNPEFKSNFVL